MGKGTSNDLKPNSLNEDTVSGVIQKIFTTDEALFELCREEYYSNDYKYKEHAAIVSLKDYVHPATGETVMTRMVKVFNKLCDEYKEKYSQYYEHRIKEGTYLFHSGSNVNNISHAFVNLKRNENFSSVKKDANGDSPKKLLKNNEIWHKSHDTALYLKDFNRAETVVGKIGQAVTKLDNIKAAAALCVCAAMAYFTYKGCARHDNNADKTEAAQKNLITATVDSTYTSADVVIQDYVSASCQGIINISGAAGDKVDEFKQFCVENGIRVKPYAAKDSLYVRYDGENHNFMINALYEENRFGMISSSIKFIKSNPNTGFVLKVEK